MIRLLQGNCLEVLKTLPDESIHCCVTSPPYWGLRDYGIPPTVWGGDPNCKHDFITEIVRGELRLGGGMVELGKRYRGGGRKVSDIPNIEVERGFCCHCEAWRGVHGLEPTIDLYVRNAVSIFREVRRVLRSDGTLWLNLGDSYAGGKTGRADHGVDDPTVKLGGNSRGAVHCGHAVQRLVTDGLKPKDLCGIPWRIAFALQADGWWLRQDIVWSKVNPMPESVTDRCTKSHEYIFLMSKDSKYYYDAESIKEKGGNPREFLFESRGDGSDALIKGKSSRQARGPSGFGAMGTRNKRSVWEIATNPFSEAHFATFPPGLIKPCIKAGTSQKGCCEKCGAPWVRHIEVKSKSNYHAEGQKHDGTYYRPNPGGGVSNDVRPRVDKGWQPTCKCNASVIPCTVLDPFGGAGTTALVSNDLGRDVISIELNPDFIKMARKRLPRLFAEVRNE